IYNYKSEECLAKYSATPDLSAFIPSSPFDQPAGQTSPCSFVNSIVSTILIISSMFLPSGKSLITACLTVPSLSIKNEPLSATDSPNNTSKSFEICLFKSATNGYLTLPIPPFSTGVSLHAKCENSLSTEQPITWIPLSSNSLILFENAIISDGHTKVKSNG